jgi:hypothetical protein
MGVQVFYRALPTPFLLDDAARLLERAYRRFEELRPTLTAERLNTLLTLRPTSRLSPPSTKRPTFSRMFL